MSDALTTTLAWTAEDSLKLLLALVLGAVIGFERELNDKPAGVKTISLVTISGTLLMLLSVKIGVLASGNGSHVDLSRLAAGVVTGIGFLGAGTIIHRRWHVQGITTAAVIWLMSGVGMALGGGFYGLALSSYFAGWAALSLDPVTKLVMRKLGLKRRHSAEALPQEGGEYGAASLPQDYEGTKGKNA